jgi:hypothetical protein
VLLCLLLQLQTWSPGEMQFQRQEYDTESPLSKAACEILQSLWVPRDRLSLLLLAESDKP